MKILFYKIHKKAFWSFLPVNLLKDIRLVGEYLTAQNDVVTMSAVAELIKNLLVKGRRK